MGRVRIRLERLVRRNRHRFRSNRGDATRDGKKRVVITGMGCVTAHGNDVDTFYEKLLEGESAVTSISEWAPHEDMATVIAAEIKGFDPEEYMTKKMARRVDPFIAYQIVAAKKALNSAKLPSPRARSSTRRWTSPAAVA